MPSPTDYPAAGRILSIEADAILFNPVNTNYELRLLVPDSPVAPIDERITGLIRVTARKLYTVPSGGNFISPIFGPPRIIQGRIRHLDDRQMVVHAGTPVIVDLPEAVNAHDLANGPLAVGTMVNVVALPGARFEAVARLADA